METDFAAVRRHLERALALLVGREETTNRFREALDILVKAAIVVENSRLKRSGKVVPIRPPR